MYVDTTRISDPYIYVWDKEVPKNTCKNIISKFEKNIESAHQGVISYGVDLLIKNSKDIMVSDTELWGNTWEEEDKLFKNTISAAMQDYYAHLNAVSDYRLFTTNQKYTYSTVSSEMFDTGYQIQKTEPGKGYVWHHDFVYSKNEQEPICRTHTFILYLNDVEEGWTQFYNGDQISPKAGRVIIFPATWTYVHQGYPPKQTKYLMTGWLHAKPDIK